MNRVSKAILITLGGLCLIGVGLLLCINLYIQSPATHARIQSELSKALKMPLVFTNTSLSISGELRMSAVTIAAAEGGNFLEAKSVSARYRLWPLLRKQLVIYDIQVDSPKVVWQQNAQGKWALPKLAKAPAVAEPKAPDAAPKPHGPKPEGFEVLLDGFRIKGGSVEFYDNALQLIGAGSELELVCTELKPDRVAGSLAVGKLHYGDSLAGENVRGPFQYAGGELSVPALDATLGGGSVKANLTLKAAAPDAPFVCQLQFEKVDSARLSHDPEGSDATGIFSGKAELHGNAHQLNRVEGAGQLSVVDAQFRQLDLFQTIGQILQIAELTNLKVSDGTCDFHVADERVFVDALFLHAPDLKMSGKGTVRFDGKLGIDARLAVEPVLAKKLPDFVRKVLVATDENGLPAIDFKVSGKIDRPKTDLAEKLLGKSLGDQFESAINGLFGSKKKKSEDNGDDAKKKDDKKKDDKKKDDKKKDEKKKDKKKKDEKPSEPPAVAEPVVPAPESAPEPVPAVPAVPADPGAAPAAPPASAVTP